MHHATLTRMFCDDPDGVCLDLDDIRSVWEEFVDALRLATAAADDTPPSPTSRDYRDVERPAMARSPSFAKLVDDLQSHSDTKTPLFKQVSQKGMLLGVGCSSREGSARSGAEFFKKDESDTDQIIERLRERGARGILGREPVRRARDARGGRRERARDENPRDEPERSSAAAIRPRRDSAVHQYTTLVATEDTPFTPRVGRTPRRSHPASVAPRVGRVPRHVSFARPPPRFAGAIFSRSRSARCAAPTASPAPGPSAASASLSPPAPTARFFLRLSP